MLGNHANLYILSGCSYLYHADFVGSHLHPSHLSRNKQGALLGDDQQVAVRVVERPVEEASKRPVEQAS